MQVTLLSPYNFHKQGTDYLAPAQSQQFSQLAALLEHVLLPSIESLARTVDDCTKPGGASLTSTSTRGPYRH